MIEYTVGDIALIAVIVGLVELVKVVTPEAYKPTVKRISPLISLVLGIVAGIVYVEPGNPELAILAGIVMGLSASGLYSGGKSIAGK